jgi:hypothetical protein
MAHVALLVHEDGLAVELTCSLHGRALQRGDQPEGEQAAKTDYDSGESPIHTASPFVKYSSGHRTAAAGPEP